MVGHLGQGDLEHAYRGLRQSPAAGHGSVHEPRNLGATAAEQAEASAGHVHFPAYAGTARHRWSGRRRPLRAVQADRRRGSGSRGQLGFAVSVLAGIGAPGSAGLCPERPRLRSQVPRADSSARDAGR